MTWIDLLIARLVINHKKLQEWTLADQASLERFSELRKEFDEIENDVSRLDSKHTNVVHLLAINRCYRNIHDELERKCKLIVEKIKELGWSEDFQQYILNN